jgi:hypothetical protein
MMKQRINLYDSNESKVKFDPLSFSGGLSIAAAIIFICLSLGIGSTFYVNFQKEQVAELKVKKKKLDADVIKEQARFTTQKVRSELVAEAARLQEEISSRKHLKALLHRVQPSSGSQFSAYLSALAEASMSQSWFVKFQLDNQQQRFMAKGLAVDGPAVPLMLEAVGNTETFQGMSVGQLNVESTVNGIAFDVTAELRAYD